MDAGELGRQTAANLHAAAVALGDDPWDPYAFVLAEAARQGLTVERVAPGFDMLDGGRASFDPEGRLIFHESCGTPFEEAFLVAHEIGHVVLGDDPDELVVNTVDLARPAEAAADGIDQSLADYGRRQRREVQMDLFARELLLPRSVARKLFVEDGMTASDIMTRLVAPFDLVAQQLFDALLLPRVEPVARGEVVKRPLNVDQAAAASHRGPPFLLEAGPGTGKTQTLVGRVEGLLADGVDPRRILLLTFSNKAAGEMAERIALVNPEAAAAMWIGTFHAFGLDLIRRFHDRLELPDDPRMLDRTEAVELLEHEFPRLKLVHYRDHLDPTRIISDLISAISRAKDEVVDYKEYARLAEAMNKEASSDEARILADKAAEVALVYEAYEHLKQSRQAIDFGDLVSIPVRLLEGDEKARGDLQQTYDHILVDEYQDVNRSSIRLLTALKPAGRGLWAVGDAKQSIYRFRGASSFNMSRFGSEDFAEGVRGRLTENYRSSREIVDAFSTFAAKMKVVDGDASLAAARGSLGHAPQLVRFGMTADQPAAVAEAVERMRSEGFSYGEQVILCSGNERLAEVAAELEAMDVPVLFLGSLFERPEVKDLLSLLSLLVDDRAMGLIRLAASADFVMPLADVAAVLQRLGEEKGEAEPDRWRVHLATLETLVSAEGGASLRALAEVLDGFDEGSPPWRVLAAFILDRSQVGRRFASGTDVSARTGAMAVWQFMNFLRVQPAGQGLPIQRLLDRIRRLVRLGDDRELRQLPAAAQELDGVRLMTIHGSKGLEFPVVHLIGMNKNSLPRTPQLPACLPPEGLVKEGEGDAAALFRSGQVQEQECLFYVALSRARDRLLIYAAKETSDGKRRDVSPFVDDLKGTIGRIETSATAVVGVAEPPIIVTNGGRLSYEATEISLYAKCPRRFLYTRVLRSGGRRTMTPFMLMHEAVRSIVASVGRGEMALDAGTPAAILSACDVACVEQGLGEHGYRADFARIAASMVTRFLVARDGWTVKRPARISIDMGGDELVVRADELRTRHGEVPVLARIQTGKKRTKDDDDLVAAAHLLAAEAQGPGTIARLHHLTDGAETDLALKPVMMGNRCRSLQDAFGEIRTGLFPAKPVARTCPGCPAFFVCGPVPVGGLEIFS
ncbi:UvrD-helicase domain-containing protein [Novosphingobium rosa]|uniref:UvrD-helicase domain-containing protein n=1 Tax=Novosphingobium rosa TaxID=76978 RepID=UPI00082CA6D2|nr:UvrD-helicase domain-containing protein [Novosphingobium rosa]